MLFSPVRSDMFQAAIGNENSGSITALVNISLVMIVTRSSPIIYCTQEDGIFVCKRASFPKWPQHIPSVSTVKFRND